MRSGILPGTNNIWEPLNMWTFTTDCILEFGYPIRCEYLLDVSLISSDGVVISSIGLSFVVFHL